MCGFHVPVLTFLMTCTMAILAATRRGWGAWFAERASPCAVVAIADYSSTEDHGALLPYDVRGGSVQRLLLAPFVFPDIASLVLDGALMIPLWALVEMQRSWATLGAAYFGGVVLAMMALSNAPLLLVGTAVLVQAPVFGNTAVVAAAVVQTGAFRPLVWVWCVLFLSRLGLELASAFVAMGLFVACVWGLLLGQLCKRRGALVIRGFGVVCIVAAWIVINTIL